MSQDKKQPTVVNIGLSSLMVVFLVLCLTTFAILSLSSAKSDYSLSEKLAAHKTAYYEVSNRSEEILNIYDGFLSDTYDTWLQSGGSLENFDAYVDYLTTAYDEAVDQLSIQTAPYAPDGLQTDFVVSDDGVPILTYQLIMDQGVLNISLQVTDPAVSEHYYKILSWQTGTDPGWNGNSTLNLMEIN